MIILFVVLGMRFTECVSDPRGYREGAASGDRPRLCPVNNRVIEAVREKRKELVLTKFIDGSVLAETEQSLGGLHFTTHT